MIVVLRECVAAGSLLTGRLTRDSPRSEHGADHAGRWPAAPCQTSQRVLAAPSGVGSRPVVGRGHRPYRSRHCSIAEITSSGVHFDLIAPGWQRLQYAYASPLRLRGWVYAPQPRHTPRSGP